ncbi:ATP-binding protein [Agarivorans sp. 1_MG-2023]|uniref:hybrid sensor histidine kinase/response regulator n=1 Tax=Agarivorans sp. 1_MG-2023 TaxID=3062634 RepID=UPI0026E2465D|nr:ATP-binding protein [Agarivorans sp. 1_MG-2023]MDO6763868.1 ATP-binding protein [Agarivorans sp. 1_MG-2023]
MKDQHVFKARRNYNRWVANQTLEDYALRFTSKSARQWSVARVSNTALGAISFLALEAIGGALMLSYGFSNSLAAILVVSAIIFFCGMPISYYAARYGVDIDLLTRGAGFGYIGSTITSLIYASFTFIFFAIEAAIMASALELLFNIPLSIGYLISAIVVIPLVTHGITFISRFQLWSQPLWLILQITPFVFILWHESSAIDNWLQYQGAQESDATGPFNLHLFGAASGILFSLMAQIGEQVDFLRFMPEANKKHRACWWLALLSAGPGWIIVGAVKILLGSFLVVLAINAGVSQDVAGDPIQMYQVAFSYMTQSPLVALSLAGIFVLVCQLKINVTNAYAGSIAWSNFFSRLTHSHPGRVVWLVFNVIIALLIMELGIYSAIEDILGIYSNVAVAWVGALVADLIINKPLGLSPKHIEFKRAHLYDINPVGVGAMVFASFAGIYCYTGNLGDTAQALAPFIGLGCAFVCSPIIAVLTQGRYYLARESTLPNTIQGECTVCQNSFEIEDLASCPAYGGAICSLCCTLDARCHDQCKTNARFGQQLSQFVALILPKSVSSLMNTRLLHFSGLMALIAMLIASLFYLVYARIPGSEVATKAAISATLSHIFFLLMIIMGVLVWLFVLANDSRQFALDESQRQTQLLSQEISAHEATDQALQQAKETAESANHAKSRYLTGISHELRTPLNSVLGYAQLLEKAPTLANEHVAKVSLIKRSGEHLADIIEGLLDISRIEAGKLELQRDQVEIGALLNDLVDMFSLQAKNKGISFSYQPSPYLPHWVVADETHLRQILINLLSNAVKFTQQGEVSLKVHYRNQVAEFTISDTGVGISEQDQERVFKPFERVRSGGSVQAQGTGLGLTITQLLTEIMGGNINLTSEPGKGSVFKLSLMLSSIEKAPSQAPTLGKIESIDGPSKTVMVVDDDPNHRNLVLQILQPLGFSVLEASDAIDCLSALEHNKVDLFLLDISMPVMSGWQLLAELRKQAVESPIIMVSANANEPSFLDAGIRHVEQALHNDYLAKPIRYNALLEKIAKALAITWRFSPITPPTPPQPSSLVANTAPTINQHQREQLNEINQMAQLGFVQGIEQGLQHLECDPKLLVITQQFRQDLSQFQFSKISMACEQLMKKEDLS